MIAILTLTSGALTVLILKVKRLVWNEDKILPVALMCVTASMVAVDIYYMTQVAFYFHLGWPIEN
jgi:hypothetical protein